MNFKLMYDKAVMDAQSLTTTEAMVALSWATVCDYQTGQRVAQSFDSVAKKAKTSRRTAIRTTQVLVNKGWLREVERHAYRPTVYALTIPAPTSDSVSLVNDPEATSDTVSLVTLTPSTSDRVSPTSDTVSPPSDTVSPNKNNYKKEDKKEDKKTTDSAAGGTVLPSLPLDQEDDEVSVTTSLVEVVEPSPLTVVEETPALDEEEGTPAASNVTSDTESLVDDEDFVIDWGFDSDEEIAGSTPEPVSSRQQEITDHINEVGSKWKPEVLKDVLEAALRINAGGYKGDLDSLTTEAQMEVMW